MAVAASTSRIVSGWFNPQAKMLQAWYPPDRLHIAERIDVWLGLQERRFALWLPVLAILGDAAYFALHRQPPLWLGGGVVLVGSALALVPRLTTRVPGLAAMFLGLGFGAAQLATWRASPFPTLPERAVRIEGRIVQIAALPEGGRILLDAVTLDGQPLGRRQLRLHIGDERLAPGQRVDLRGRVAPPPPPAYPGGRDLQRDAFFDDLAGYGYALGPVAAVGRPGAAWIASIRARIATRTRQVLPGPDGAIAGTLLAGEAAAIPAPILAAFRDAGLAHLLAIAGLHIGIVMGLVLAAAQGALIRVERAALFWPVRQIAALAALAAGFAYLELTGMHVPILRSFVMACLGAMALFAGRQAVSLRGWAVACVAVVLAEPEQVAGASFQLSFAAVLALIAGYEALRDPLARLRGEARWRRGAVLFMTLGLTSLLAGGASLPFVAYNFGRIQLYFVIANLVAVPVTALWVMPAGMLALILMPVGLDRPAFVAMGWGITVLRRVAQVVAGWPGAALQVADVTLAALLPMALGLAWICLWRGRTRLLGLIGVSIAIVIWGLAPTPDLLVAADGRMAALRANGRLYLWSPREPDPYTAAAWSQLTGLPAVPASRSPFCDTEGCLATDRGIRLGGNEMPCGDAILLVTLSGLPPWCPGTWRLGRTDSWQMGAWSAYMQPGRPPLLVADRDLRGDRPWVLLPPELARARVVLPMAPSEMLPAAP